MIAFGAEKIVVSDSVLDGQQSLEGLVNKYGKQAISVSIDYRFREGIRWVVTGANRRRYTVPLSEHLESFDFESAGELILSNVDLDGTNRGLDVSVVSDASLQDVPMPILLNCGFDGNNLDALGASGVDGFVSSRHFCLYGSAPLVNYGSDHAIC